MDPRVVHTVSVELCTAAALFTSICILMKLASDGYLRFFESKWGFGDKLAAVVTKLVEPSSYLLAIGAVFFTFISMGTGMNAWPLDALFGSVTAHNKMMLTAFSQMMFMVFVAMRFKFGVALWENKKLVVIYSLLAIFGGVLVALQNSVAGHLAGKGSLLDPVLTAVGLDLTKELVLQPLFSIAIMVVCTGALAITVVFYRMARTRTEEEITSPEEKGSKTEPEEPDESNSEQDTEINS